MKIIKTKQNKKTTTVDFENQVDNFFSGKYGVLSTVVQSVVLQRENRGG